MLHADQRWLDFVPALFDHHILRDPTYDVAYWNLHERPTAWLDGRLPVGDRPVRCFHYSGLTDARPWLLSGFTADRPRVALAELPAVAQQCRAWLDRRRAVGAEADRALGYHWPTLPGRRPRRPLRWLVRSALLAAEADPTGATPSPPAPFAPDGGEAWEAWLRRPERPDGVGSYLQQLWNEAGFLQQQFPEVPGADRAAFLAWVDSPAADEAAIPAAFRPRSEELHLSGVDAPAPILLRASSGRPQQPLPDLVRFHHAQHATPSGTRSGRPGGRQGAPPTVDRAHERSAEATTALADAVADLSRRLAEAEADLTRRQAEAEAEQAQRLAVVDQVYGGPRPSTWPDGFGAVEAALTAPAMTSSGPWNRPHHRRHPADAEKRVTDELGDLRLRVAELAIEMGTEEDPP